jgi:hypothetical protein
VLTADSTETSGLKYTTPTVGTVTDVTSSTTALTVATSTTTPALTIRAATTSVNGIVQLSDSTSTTSSTLAATPTAVKAAYDLAALALPKAGGVITGALEIGNTGSLVFEGSTNDGNETTITVADPTADRTITFPNVTGNVVTTGDTGTVTSTMIANSTIVNADINASAEIAVSKLADGAARQLLQTDAAGTGVEWTNNVDIPGTLDVTGATVLDGDLTIPDKIIHAGDTNTAIRFPAADTIAFETDGSERARIDSSGRLLVGTSTAATNYRSGGSSSTPTEQIVSSDLFGLGVNRTSGPGGISIANSQSSISNGTVIGRLSYNANDGTNLIQAALILAEVDGTPGTDDMPGRLIFSTTADGSSSVTERMRIDSSGRLGLGTTSPATTLHVNGDVTISDKIVHANDSNTAIRFPAADTIAFETGGSERARVDSSGRLLMGEVTPATAVNHSICTPGRLQSEGTYSITTGSSANVFISTEGLFSRSTSSLKYKTDVEDADIDYSEALVYGSRPVWYRSLSESDPSEYSYWGFIAEEVAEIDPRMVHWGNDGPEGVQYDRYVVHLVSVIQKQQQRLDALETRIAALELN